MKVYGPFCSKKCSGKYGKMIQEGHPALSVQPGCPVEERVYRFPAKHQ